MTAAVTAERSLAIDYAQAEQVLQDCVLEHGGTAPDESNIWVQRILAAALRPTAEVVPVGRLHSALAHLALVALPCWGAGIAVGWLFWR